MSETSRTITLDLDWSNAREPQPDGPPSASNLQGKLPIRHDGLTAEQMARFCEVLAEKGTVTLAAEVIGKSRDTVYQHRRRNPLFAAAWFAALSHARDRLADHLLERAIEGSIDYIYRDGEVVGERHHMDNRLAYAMLRRLDKQAEADPQPVATELARQRGRVQQPAKPDFGIALKALRTGSEEDLCAALAVWGPDAGKTDKTDNPPNPQTDTVRFDDSEPFGTSRIWEGDYGEWRTNCPPPPGFDGDEEGAWHEDDYHRSCTAEELAVLDQVRERQLAGQRAAEEAERAAFFAQLRAELEEPASLPVEAGEQQEDVGREQGEDGQGDDLVHPFAAHQQPDHAEADEDEVEGQILRPGEPSVELPLPNDAPADRGDGDAEGGWRLSPSSGSLAGTSGRMMAANM